MGIVRMGPPEDLCFLLKQQFELKDFIESGTFHGRTAVWASQHFENVTTIEYSREIFEATSSRHNSIFNIRFVFGDSRSVLKEIVPALERPAIFWLDGHWSSGATYGEKDQCPLLEELETVLQAPIAHFLLIDDARLFLSPPPLPNDTRYWPSIDRIMASFAASGHVFRIVVLEDVLIAVPDRAADVLVRYSQDLNTKQWRGRNRNKNRWSLIAAGLRQLIRSLFRRP